MQTSVRNGFGKTQTALIGGLALAQGLLKLNQKRMEKQAKQSRKDLNTLMKEQVQPRLNATQATLQSGMQTAQSVLGENARKAQQNLKFLQENVQSAMGSGLQKTQGLLDKGSKQAGKALEHVSSSARDMKESMQDQYQRYQRRRQRARTMFRVGLLVGIAGALLLTPYPGSEVRQRIGEQWQKVRGYLGM
ncbi:YtxH domain-containing protein [Thermosporothrix hazakensis]|nr:YtxH domain-containing protein [Thermosporothrix hazakensis]